MPTSETGFPVNSEGAWTAQEVCGYLNITQDELDALFSGEPQTVVVRAQSTYTYSNVVTGDPSDYAPMVEEVEEQTVQINTFSPLFIPIYTEGYDPTTVLGVPGLKIISLGSGKQVINLYKLNERYGTSYHYEASM